jgi:protein-tyrosine phosphatase
MKEIYMDIHTHIIPGVDDGSESMEQSMKMIAQAYDEGIRAIIATPHYGVVNYGYDGNKVQEAFHELRREVKKAYPDMHLFIGNEIY